MYVVAFNGPPECGKDTLAEMLAEHMTSHGFPYSQIRMESLSKPLRRIAYTICGWGGDTEGQDYEAFKRTRFNLTDGLVTLGRQVMIDTSEKFLKPVYGIEIMARMLIERNRDFDGVLLIRDCGFQIEIDPINQWLGADRLLVVNVKRPGKTFENDSREWVNHLFQMSAHNVGTLDDLRIQAGGIYKSMVNRMGWQL